MTLRLYDTYTRSLRDFQPLHAPKVGLYSCGPTVYDYAHLGNLRTYVFVDLLRRVLGLGLAKWQPAEAIVPAGIGQLVQQRQQARAARQWPLADQLRAQIGAAGYEDEDTAQGPQVHHARPKELV